MRSPPPPRPAHFTPGHRRSLTADKYNTRIAHVPTHARTHARTHTSLMSASRFWPACTAGTSESRSFPWITLRLMHSMSARYLFYSNTCSAPCIHPFIRSFTHPSIHPSIHSFTHSFIQSINHRASIHAPIHSSIHSFTHPFIHPASVHSSIHSFMNSPIHPFIHPSRTNNKTERGGVGWLRAIRSFIADKQQQAGAIHSFVHSLRPNKQTSGE